MWFDGLSTSRCFWGVIDERRAETRFGRPRTHGEKYSRGLDGKISYLTKIWGFAKGLFATMWGSTREAGQVSGLRLGSLV